MIDNASGHYLLKGDSAKNAAVEVFSAAGYSVRENAYVEKVWDPGVGAWVKKQ